MAAASQAQASLNEMNNDEDESAVAPAPEVAE